MPSGETLETGVGVAKALVVEIHLVLLVVAGFDVEGDVLDLVGITEELLPQATARCRLAASAAVVSSAATVAVLAAAVPECGSQASDSA